MLYRHVICRLFWRQNGQIDRLGASLTLPISDANLLLPNRPSNTLIHRQFYHTISTLEQPGCPASNDMTNSLFLFPLSISV